MVVEAGPHLLALLAQHNGGAGVLAHRQNAAGGDIGVLEQLIGDEAVVVGGFRIVDDIAYLPQMAGAQQVRDVAERLESELGQRLRLDLEDRGSLEIRQSHVIAGQLAIGGIVLGEGKHVAVSELCHRNSSWLGAVWVRRTAAISCGTRRG